MPQLPIQKAFDPQRLQRDLQMTKGERGATTKARNWEADNSDCHPSPEAEVSEQVVWKLRHQVSIKSTGIILTCFTGELQSKPSPYEKAVLHISIKQYYHAHARTTLSLRCSRFGNDGNRAAVVHGIDHMLGRRETSDPGHLCSLTLTTGARDAVVTMKGNTDSPKY